MAALMFTVPESVRRVLKEIDVPGTPVSDDMHTTLVHLGDDVSVEQIGKTVSVLYEVTSTVLPFTLESQEVGTFDAGEEGVPIIAHVRSPEIHALKSQVTDALDAAGIPYSKKFPEYRPHVTLAYGDSEPEVEDFEYEFSPISWPATELLLWGANRGTGRLMVTFPFSLPRGKAAFHRAMVRVSMHARH